MAQIADPDGLGANCASTALLARVAELGALGIDNRFSILQLYPIDVQLFQRCFSVVLQQSHQGSGCSFLQLSHGFLSSAKH
jgi:hypothetical protein